MMHCKLILPPNDIYKLPAIPASFDDLVSEIRSRLIKAGKEAENFTLKYMDSENELVTLASQDDLTTAIVSSKTEQLKSLKIHVFITDSPKTGVRNLALNCNGKVKLTVKAKTADKILGQYKDTTPEKAEKINLTQANTTPRKSVKCNLESLGLSNDQLNVIKDFVGLKVMDAIEANMKNLVPGFISQLKGKQTENSLNSSVIRDLSRSFTQELNQSLNIGRGAMNLSTDVNNMLSSALSNKVNNTPAIICKECNEAGKQVRYVCPECSDYKCCETCEEKAIHQHPLLKLKASESQNTKTTLNMRFSTSESPKGSFTSSLNRSFTIKNSNEKKINYKGVIYLEKPKSSFLKLGPNESYAILVTVKNTGNEIWPDTARLSCVNGIYRGKDIDIYGLESDEKKTFNLKLKTPKKAGKYLSQWRLYYDDTEAGKQRSFGESLFLEVQVEEREEEVKENESKKKEVLKLADYLNDIYPGNLEEKIRFIEKNGFQGENDMCKVVEIYLQEHVRKMRSEKTPSGCRPESQKLGEKLGMSLML